MTRTEKMDALHETIRDARAAEADLQRCGLSIAAANASTMAVDAMRQLDDLRLEVEGGVS